MKEFKAVTIAEAFEEYLQKVSILKKGYEQERHRIGLLSRSFLGALIVSEATSVHVSTYRDMRLLSINPKTNKSLSPATIRLELALLSNFFDICRIEWGYCDGNPVANVRKPKPSPGRDRRVTPREERMIVRWCDARGHQELKTIFLFALETAMRAGEILQLRWEYVKLNTRIAHLPDTKNGAKRDVPLSLKARDLLVGMGVKSNGRVFTYSSAGLKSSWKSMLKRLGIDDLHFHDTRHEATSRLFELSVFDVMEVAAITGHKSLSMLKRYTHLKAQKLVAKLEGRKSKGRSAVLEAMVPYPALVRTECDHFKVHLLDFDCIYAIGATREEALKEAGNLLLRQLLMRMKEDRPAPPPDAYLDLVDQDKVVMVDPLLIVS